MRRTGTVLRARATERLVWLGVTRDDEWFTWADPIIAWVEQLPDDDHDHEVQPFTWDWEAQAATPCRSLHSDNVALVGYYEGDAEPEADHLAQTATEVRRAQRTMAIRVAAAARGDTP